MSRAALYQKYRSKDFEEVVGQEYVVRSVRNAVRENKVGHAYLFCGPRGTGKTTMARLLAKAVNCEDPSNAPCGHCPQCIAANEGTHPDIVEMNAANETHVEDIRDLIDRARLSPMLGRHKIYIIDEVHQLSSSAASALLKTLEEPPSHVIFILATTDPQKLLPTIVSRCQRFDFSKVGRLQIKDHLLHIAEEEQIRLEPEAAEKIAELADGGMRDALSILEQTISYAQSDITEEDINRIYGLTSTSRKIELIQNIHRHDMASVIEDIRACEQRGIDLERLNSELIDVLRDGAVYKTTGKTSLLRVLNDAQAEELCAAVTVREMIGMIDALMKALETYRISQSATSCFEVACLNMMLAADGMPEEKPAATKPLRITAPAAPEEETPEAVTEEIPVKTPEETKQVIPANVEDVLNLLLQSDKNSKAEDTGKLGPLLNGTQMNRYLNNLRSSTVAASGPDSILFVSRMAPIVSRINEAEYNRELYEYLRDTAHIDKRPFAAEQEIYDLAVKEFVNRRKNGTLPAVKPVERYRDKTETAEQKPDPEQQLIRLFGKDIVNII